MSSRVRREVLADGTAKMKSLKVRDTLRKKNGANVARDAIITNDKKY